jgi:hypothetical protein
VREQWWQHLNRSFDLVFDGEYTPFGDPMLTDFMHDIREMYKHRHLVQYRRMTICGGVRVADIDDMVNLLRMFLWADVLIFDLSRLVITQRCEETWAYAIRCLFTPGPTVVEPSKTAQMKLRKTIKMPDDGFARYIQGLLRPVGLDVQLVPRPRYCLS